MAQWYHRNALKNTAPHKFNLSLVAATPASIQLCNALATSRSKLLQMVTDASTGADNIHSEFVLYLSLLQGFVLTYGLDKNHGPSDSSKLRHLTVFKWSNSVTGVVEQQQDSIFELCSMSVEYSLWCMKHASWLASTKEEVTMDDAKQVHSSLRRAAGVLSYVQTHWLEQLLGKPVPGSDMDTRVISAYITTCQAEAQEVTIARAIELKHSSSLISALANQTSQMFQSAVASLQGLDVKYFGKWMIYLKLKSTVYMSYVSLKRTVSFN